MKGKNECCKKSYCLNDIIESIALEEAGIAHILNAEGEKIQKALEGDITFDEIIKLNKQVACVINDITNLEITLSGKIKALGCLQNCKPEAGCTLTVLVSECATKDPICDAIVKVCKSDVPVQCGITDCNGAFTACMLEKCCYTVHVKVGNQEKWRTVDLSNCSCNKSVSACFDCCVPCESVAQND